MATKSKAAGQRQVALVWGVRVLVGGLFLFSGWIKANDLTGFVYKLEEYFHVFAAYTPGFLRLIPLAPTIAGAITLLELGLGLLLLLGLWRRVTVWLLLALIVFFTLLTGYSAVTGAVTDCGCFGEVLKLTPWQSFGKDVILLLLILFLYLHQEAIRPLLGPKRHLRVAPGLFVVVVLLLGVYVYVGYHHLPLVDFTAYAEGQDLVHNTTTRNAEGQYIAKDWTSWGAACSDSTQTLNEFRGWTLLVVLYDASDSTEVRRSGELARAVQANGVQVIGGSSLLSDQRDRLRQRLALPYCLAPQDATLLKTMIRSSPGYLLLHNGVVVRKWHKNDEPTAAEIAGVMGGQA